MLQQAMKDSEWLWEEPSIIWMPKRFSEEEMWEARKLEVKCLGDFKAYQWVRTDEIPKTGRWIGSRRSKTPIFRSSRPRLLARSSTAYGTAQSLRSSNFVRLRTSPANSPCRGSSIWQSWTTQRNLRPFRRYIWSTNKVSFRNPRLLQRVCQPLATKLLIALRMRGVNSQLCYTTFA